MNKLCVLLFFALTSTSLIAQTVKFSSTTPEVGKVISFEYNPIGGELEKLSNINCMAKMQSNRDNRVNLKIDLEKVGGIYKGKFTPLDSAQIVVLVFSANETKDENPNGYFTKFYRNGAATAMSLFLEGYLYAGFGKNLAKIEVDLPKALTLYNKAFELDPKLKVNYINNYLLTLYTLDKIKGEKAVYETIAFYKNEPTEINLLKIVPLYNIINKKAMGDSVYASIKFKYPIGAYALSLETSSLRAIKDANKREERFNEILRDFKLDLRKRNDISRVNWFFDILGQGFADVKNFDKAELYFDKFEPKSIRAIYYHKIAQKNFAEKTNLEFAEKISKKAMDLIDSMRIEPFYKFYASEAEYFNYLDELARPYQITYLSILESLEKTDQALTAAESMVTAQNFSNPELNTLYVKFLTKSGRIDESIKYAERFIKNGQGNSQLKANLKLGYQGTTPFEIYYADLEKEANAKQRIQFSEQMINIPAPKFTLTNLKGQKIGLDNLKGKIVVVDYWATWCGPCISSFPGMQMAVDKYKNDPNVVFLFINTWEKQEGKMREKPVRDWINAHPKYTFNVLLDTKSIGDQNDYDVISRYKVDAIPTKFIIDGNGNIRFKIIGSSDVAETIVKELDVMIELAKGG